MKKRSQKIDKLVVIAKADERRTGEAAGRLRVRLGTELERLGELNAHRHVYANKVNSMMNVNSAHMKDFQSFMHRLDQAARSQQQIIRDCEQHFETHRRQWMAKRQKLKSLERVLDRYRRDEALYADRQEQRRLDDIPMKTASYSVEPGD